MKAWSAYLKNHMKQMGQAEELEGVYILYRKLKKSAPCSSSEYKAKGNIIINFLRFSSMVFVYLPSSVPPNIKGWKISPEYANF